MEEAARCRVEVTRIDHVMALFGYSPVGLGDVQGSLPALAATLAN
jgi:hypothetical protein